VAGVHRCLARVVGVHVFILGAEVAPLEAVHGAQVVDLAVRQPNAVQVLAAAVAVPDTDALVLQLLRVGGALDVAAQGATEKKT
jgi:hypothetical protein